MRFAVTARKNGHEVKVFLMGEAVEIESLHHEKFDVAAHVETVCLLSKLHSEHI